VPTVSSSVTRLAALTIGPLVPAGDFAFRVHSLFGSAVNLAVSNRRGLLTLVGETADDYPHGIRIATRERLDAWPLAVGTPGRREGRTLVFEGPDGRERLAIDLTLAVTHRRRPVPRIDPATEALHEAWAVCAFHLDGLQAEKEADLRLAALCCVSPPPTTVGERLAGAVHELADGVRAGDAGAAGSAAGRLLGLGAGLTPSGDDFLCGLLAALWCAGPEGGPERHFVREWGAALAAQLDATNAISATFLEGAIAGCFPAKVLRLATALAEASAGHAHEGARAALDDLCALGHSSGMDVATGFLFGLRLRTGTEMRRYAPRL
jgi:hypothetical protein